MPTPLRLPSLALLACAFLQLLAPSSLHAGSPKWDPIPKEDLSATSCPSSAEAKAENLFIHEFLDRNVRSFHRRIKLYSADPAVLQAEGMLEITYLSSEKVWDLYARVVKPDGRSSEYTAKDFKESLALKTRDGKINRLTAAFRDVGEGDVVEMKWTCPMETDVGNTIWGYCQQLIPTREYITRIREIPNDNTALVMNLANATINTISRYECEIVVKNIPAYTVEPHSPPSMDVRGWYGVFMTHAYWRGDKPHEVWDKIAEYYFDEYKFTAKPNAGIKNAAAAAIAGATTDEAKLAAIYDWCQEKITNLSYFKNADQTKLRQKRDGDEKWAASDTFANRAGYTNDINTLFAAMARAAGFEVRLTYAASRARATNVAFPQGFRFFNDTLIAVKLGENWRYYAPGDYFVPAGLLHHTNETVSYMRCDETKAILGHTPGSSAPRNGIVRKARLTLDQDGNLEGDIEVSYDGLSASVLKEEWHGDTQETIDNEYRTSITQALPSAEVGELTWSNLRVPRQPLSVKYHVKVPAYAELLGERLAFSPSFFTKSITPEFPAAERKAPIHFKFPRLIQDEIELLLPEGYELDSPSSPASVTDKNRILNVSYKIGYKKKSGLITYKRTYAQCDAGNSMFKADAYPLVKRLFELTDASDKHTFLCKPKAAVDAGGSQGATGASPISTTGTASAPAAK